MKLDKIKQVKLSQVRVNKQNPRTIAKDKFQKLVTSILVFPKMLMIRPIVVDNVMQALGGNMRNNALNYITQLSPEEIAERLYASADYQRKTEAEKKALLDWWDEWLTEPTAYIIDASELSEDERRQFVIKDNTSFGQWDYDALANKWDSAQLNDWGMDVWNASPTAFAPLGATPTAATPEQAQPDESEDDGTGDATPSFDGALPPEIDGKDLTPDELPKYDGEENTPCDYITITYDGSERELLAERLGVSPERLFEKICWRIDELVAMQEEAGHEE
mgnify:CR=1 FL=1